MTTLEARWAQLAFWDAGGITALHARELAREAKNEESREKGLAPEEWMDLAYISAQADQQDLVPYWGQHVAQDVRNERLRAFLAQIWPIWKGHQSRAKDTEPDYKWVHEADLAVHARCARQSLLDRGRNKRAEMAGQEAATGERWHE